MMVGGIGEDRVELGHGHVVEWMVRGMALGQKFEIGDRLGAVRRYRSDIQHSGSRRLGFVGTGYLVDSDVINNTLKIL